MVKKLSELGEIEIKSRQELRDWLEKNHTSRQSIWVVTFKKNVPSFYLPYTELVDECLCYGWIDSLPRKGDENRTKHLISPRSEKSNWSKVNKEKSEALIASGKMHQSGLLCIEKAKANGTWSALDLVSSLEIPEDLLSDFLKYTPALINFENFPPSTRRGILEWIQNAKTSLTRAKRCLATAEGAQKNQRVLEWKAKEKQNRNSKAND